MQLCNSTHTILLTTQKSQVKIEKSKYVQELLGPHCYVGRVRLRACGVYHLLPTNILVCVLKMLEFY